MSHKVKTLNQIIIAITIIVFHAGDVYIEYVTIKVNCMVNLMFSYTTVAIIRADTPWLQNLPVES